MKHTTKPASLRELESALGHTFVRPELLERAMTHSSLASESGNGTLDNEPLEFLGDSVLGLVTSLELFARFPQFNEGQLSKLKAHLVSSRHLLRTANALELGRYLRLGRGEEKTGGRSKAALLADAVEATIAALYLDAGLETAQCFIHQHILAPELERISPEAALGLNTDHKSLLQELLQASGRPAPNYMLVDSFGPEHKKTFVVEAQLISREGDVEHVERAQGSTKKRAEQTAAEHMLSWMKPMQEKA